MKTFLEWYDSIPGYVEDGIEKDYNKIHENQEISIKKTSTTMNYKIYEINCILQKLSESDLSDKKPTIKELKLWIQTNQL